MILLSAASILVGCGSLGAAPPSATSPVQQENAVAGPPTEKIDAYHARFGREHPVIAVIGVNSGTELTDYVIPYGVLRQAGVGEVLAVATRPGPMTMRPALRIQPQATIAEFDDRFPDGADYVVVPAVVDRTDPALLQWIKAQAAKGSTLVSICDGALVLAGGGLLNGHRATAHWATEGYRRKTYPQVRWVSDRRYVADGKLVSSAGISAAIPTSLALVEAIAGRERAAAVAAEMGAGEWSPIHDSQRFHPKLGRNLSAFATTQYLNGWFHHPQSVGIPVANRVDEVSLALTADAYTRSGRARAYAVSTSQAPVQSLHGLTLLPERFSVGALDRTVTVPGGKPAMALDGALSGIVRLYGRQTAFGVALDFEYPGYNG
ncbi:DJ-1/PfpI family protein [Sphingomonas morindae]|uniref:DJ-1/PfpI family protein n=1 Tax=Sphingomonas morindae TaxID=1541170 RepID=A0ABY4X9E8_9SPHN|nr:DJ-1/PfpI family protein [Sphingomonas morindae]USI73523.1 DJ-1/PfpI family protein [Sphingomonas morindae]